MQRYICFLPILAALASAKPSQKPTCDLPATYRWVDSGPLAEPKNGWVSLKDFSTTSYKGKKLIYATNHDNGTIWSSLAFGLVDDWSQLSSATQTGMTQGTVAPTLFYFAPKNIWVLAYQWCHVSFCYKTSTNPTDPSSWTSGSALWSGQIAGLQWGPLDQTLIADDKNMYIFFAGDNGSIYGSSMPIGQFPGSFGTAYQVILTDTRELLFEAVQVYTVAGQAAGSPKKYLMIVEAMGKGGRYFRSFTAPKLSGPWAPDAVTEEAPFAGTANANTTWSDDVSHGDLYRKNPDQTMTVDPCNLQFLYQGKAKGSTNVDYGLWPYRPAVLTLQRK